MATGHPSLVPEIGPDGIVKEAPVIAYTEKIIEAEQNQLKKYIQDNYSKIRDVERDLENLTLELKLTAGPKKAALEHMRKKIELATERIRLAKIKEGQARKFWEEAVKVVQDEEAIKQKLCDDLNQLVQESNSTQFARLEELKRRLEALNPARASCDIPDGKIAEVQSGIPVPDSARQPIVNSVQPKHENSVKPKPEDSSNQNSTGNASTSHGQAQKRTESDGKKKKLLNLGIGKGRGSSNSGWTGAGFDVDGRI